MTDYNALAPNYSAPANPLAGFYGPISKGRREERRGGEGMKGEGSGGREGEGVGKKGRGCPVFAEPTCQPQAQTCMHLSDDVMLRCCPAMPREQILTVNP